MFGGLLIGFIALIVVIVSMFQRAGQHNGLTATSTAPFGSAASQAQGGGMGGIGTSGGNLPNPNAGTVVSSQKVFKIADGPVVAATLFDAGIPTTTSARYITAEDGHIYELPWDVAGAMPKVLSNTTIPGVARAVWTDRGNGVLMQYLQGSMIKTVHVLFATSTATTTSAPGMFTPVLRYLPDGITQTASSPDQRSILYALRSAAGSDVYMATTDGSNAKKVFSSPLGDIELSWPATSTAFFYMKSSGGVPGIGFAANLKTGSVLPVLNGVGVTASANPLLSHVLYRTDTGNAATTYVETLATGQSVAAYSSGAWAVPIPETCVWNPVRPLQAFCATPVRPAPAGYLELWHRGQASVSDTIVSVDVLNPATLVVATPGTKDGGEASDVLPLSIAPDAHYIAFISKDDQKLWGVRL